MGISKNAKQHIHCDGKRDKNVDSYRFDKFTGRSMWTFSSHCFYFLCEKKC